MLYLFLSILCATALHIFTIAIVAHMMDVKVREVSLGFGKQLFQFKWFKLKIFPLGGSVRMVHSSDEDLPPKTISKWALNYKPVWVQLVIASSGVIALISVAMAINSEQALSYFYSGFSQFILGAVSPTGTAQEYFAQIHSFIVQAPFITILIAVMAKLAAFNLLPLPALNGGDMLMIIAKAGKPEVWWEEKVLNWALWPLLIIYVSWIIALLVYAFS